MVVQVTRGESEKKNRNGKTCIITSTFTRVEHLEADKAIHLSLFNATALREVESH
jgi:hypothetical protein